MCMADWIAREGTAGLRPAETLENQSITKYLKLLWRAPLLRDAIPQSAKAAGETPTATAATIRA